MSTTTRSGLFQAILDAIHGSDDSIAGQPITRLTAPLADDATEIAVESTVGFGENVDDAGDALIVVGGEIIACSGRTDTTFTGLTRGVKSSKVAALYHVDSVVYDISRNTSALDLARRGMSVNTAVGEDLNVIGRNLGLIRCSGIAEETWRAVIKAVAYLAKQTPNAVITALDAIIGPSNYVFVERLVSSPNRFFVNTVVVLGDSLQGKFFLNSGEPAEAEAGGIVNVDYPIADVTFEGAAAVGSILAVSGAFLNDGEVVVIDDGVNPAVTFEFDDDGSVIDTATLRAITFTATSSDAYIRDALVIAITASALAIDATPAGGRGIDLANQALLAAGNVTITTTVADSEFVVSGMAAGDDPGVLGVAGVYLDNAATRDGIREGQTNYFVGGSYLGSAITLGTDPGTGTAVIVDYHAFQAHYLPPDDTFRNDGDAMPPYLSDSLSAPACLLEQVRAAGVRAVFGALV